MAKRQIKVTATESAPKPVKVKAPKAAPAVEVAATAEVSKVPAGVNRTANTIAKQATNFGGVMSDRDLSYIAFWATFAKKAGGSVSLADLAKAGRNTMYHGSAKAHDAGVAVRLTKAGIINVEDGGHKLTFTDFGKSHAAYKSA